MNESKAVATVAEVRLARREIWICLVIALAEARGQTHLGG
jgi:hypothetical protein